MFQFAQDYYERDVLTVTKIFTDTFYILFIIAKSTRAVEYDGYISAEE